MVTTLTRVTHSCALLDFDGQALLTDPWFSEKPGYYRGEPLAYTPATLPRLSAVIASHDHYDHYDLGAFSAYPDKAVPFIVGRGMAEKARQAGFTNVTEAEPWEQVTIDGLRVTAPRPPRSAGDHLRHPGRGQDDLLRRRHPANSRP